MPDVKATIAEYYLTQEEYTKAMLELEEAVLIQKIRILRHVGCSY